MAHLSSKITQTRPEVMSFRPHMDVKMNPLRISEYVSLVIILGDFLKHSVVKSYCILTSS